MDDLAILHGEWTTKAFGTTGWATFAPVLSGAFVLWRSGFPDVPEAPDTHALLDPAGGVLHYFDSRSVVRRYALALDAGAWTLERHRPEADFAQRYTGRIADDGTRIDGAWEIERDGALVHDFDLTYMRRASR